MEDRFPRAHLFIDRETGQLNEYARRAHLRVLADVLYLSRWRDMGAAAAGEFVCARYGHDARGGRCERCGQHV
jgi:hypothetical protein